MYFGKKITYKKLFHEVENTARALKKYGIAENENVVLCAPATPETIYMILALNRIGANAVMLNPTFTTQQLIDRTAETNAKLLFVIDELYQRMKDVIPHTSIQTVISCPAVNSLGVFIKLIKQTWKTSVPHSISWNKFVASGNKDLAVGELPYVDNRPAIMVYSSGTTGASKGIQLTNSSVNATICEGVKIGFDWQRQDRYFAQVPIWFSTGLCATILVPLTYGITIILEPVYDFEIFYQHISKYHPNFMITAAGLLDYLMIKRELEPAYKEFKFLVIGGEYVTPHAERRFNDWLKKNGCKYELYKGYGMCECGGTVTASSPRSNTLGSAGIPTPHVTVSAFSIESGEELQYGQRGEIRVSTPCRMLGYYKNAKATSDYFHVDANGNTWACTGDMGYIAEDGSVFVSGRISDSYINSASETIYLFDIERAVLDIPQVRQCKAVVSEIEGANCHVCHIALDAKEAPKKAEIKNKIKQHCKEVLAESHYPTLFKFYDTALPVSPSGKLDVSQMKKDILAVEK